MQTNTHTHTHTHTHTAAAAAATGLKQSIKPCRDSSASQKTGVGKKTTKKRSHASTEQV